MKRSDGDCDPDEKKQQLASTPHLKGNLTRGNAEPRRRKTS